MTLKEAQIVGVGIVASVGLVQVVLGNEPILTRLPWFLSAIILPTIAFTIYRQRLELKRLQDERRQLEQERLDAADAARERAIEARTRRLELERLRAQRHSDRLRLMQQNPAAAGSSQSSQVTVNTNQNGTFWTLVRDVRTARQLGDALHAALGNFPEEDRQRIGENISVEIGDDDEGHMEPWPEDESWDDYPDEYVDDDYDNYYPDELAEEEAEKFRQEMTKLKRELEPNGPPPRSAWDRIMDEDDT